MGKLSDTDIVEFLKKRNAKDLQEITFYGDISQYHQTRNALGKFFFDKKNRDLELFMIKIRRGGFTFLRTDMMTKMRKYTNEHLRK